MDMIRSKITKNYPKILCLAVTGGKSSMVGATFPTAPPVRIAKSRQFSIAKVHNVKKEQVSRAVAWMRPA